VFLIVKTLHRFFTLLNSETSPAQLAAGISLGAIVGLTPLFTLHNLLIFLGVCLFRVNFSMFFLSFGWFSVLAFLLDPIFDVLGYALLVDFRLLRPCWISIAQNPFMPFFHWNNTIVMGSLVVSLVLAGPLFLLTLKAVRLYRERWREAILASPFMKFLKTTPLYGLFERYQNLKTKLV
jgi:uncharacterized protein (TIGR03546 family)